MTTPNRAERRKAAAEQRKTPEQPPPSTPQGSNVPFQLASVFLKMIDRARECWEFRTFDDVVLENGSTRKDAVLTRRLSGSIGQAFMPLKRLNAAGAGVFVTINKTDGKGVKTENVTGVQAFFVDTDGADLLPLLVLRPHIAVQSSPGRWHIYWLVADCELSQFKPIQSAIAAKFGTDKSVCDLPRVMRLPGFFHNKHEAFLMTLLPQHMDPRRAPYSVQEVVAGLQLQTHASKSKATSGTSPLGEASEHIRGSELGTNTVSSGPPQPVEVMRAALQYLVAQNYFEHRKEDETDDDGNLVKVGWIKCGMALKAAYGDKIGFELWSVVHRDDEARRDAVEQWKSFAAEVQPGHIRIGTIIKAAKDAGFAFGPGTQSGSVDPTTIACEQFTGQGADVWNGKKFAEMFRSKLLHIHETGEMLLFSPEQGWVSAPPGEVDRAAKKVLRTLRDEAAERYKVAKPDDPVVKRMMAHIHYTSIAKNLRAMIEMAKSEPGMTVPATDFDANPLLLGVQNGVLDLRRGKLLSPSPEILVSKRCNVSYDPEAECRAFLKYLKEVQPDLNIRAFLLRFAGYCLTGAVGQKVFLVLTGIGDNGKTVFVELLNWLLGSYASKIETEMLMTHQRNPQSHSADIVKLKGLRFVYANETSEGKRLDDARIKDLTGGDTLTGRAPYGRAAINFAPTHKLIISGNHKPEITDNSSGMWSRVGLVPFDVVIPLLQRDRYFLSKLQAEGAGILNWFLRGYATYRDHGLLIPPEIIAATQAYREDQDIIGEWKSEHCNVGPGCKCAKSDAYQAYRSWAQKNGHGVLSQKRFTRRLKGVDVQDSPDKRSFDGIELNQEGRLAAIRNL